LIFLSFGLFLNSLSQLFLHFRPKFGCSFKDHFPRTAIAFFIFFRWLKPNGKG